MNLLSEKYSKYLEVLGNAERIKMIELLMQKDMCVKEINTHFYAAQATISYHLALLKEVGFVNTKKDGKFVFYSIDSSAIKTYLKSFVSDFNLCLR